MLEDGSEYASEGRLEFSEVSVDSDTGSVTLRAVFPKPQRALLPGMYVRAQLTQGEVANGILVPHAAVSRDPRGTALVMVVGAEDKVESRPVTAAISRGDKWLITDGLAAGDKVIVDGLQKIRPAQRSSRRKRLQVLPHQPPRLQRSEALSHGPLLHRPTHLRVGHRHRHHARRRTLILSCRYPSTLDRAARGRHQRPLPRRLGQGGRRLRSHRSSSKAHRSGRPAVHELDQ